MLFFIKKIKISNHAKNRFKQRCEKENIFRCIYRDLQTNNIVKKSPKNEKNEFKVLTKNNRLYICKELEKYIVIKTVIQLDKNSKKKIDFS